MGRRGSILVWVLMLSAVLLMLATVILFRLRSGSFFGRGQIDDQEALLAAESGLSLAMSELAADRTWSAGLSGKLADGESSYSVTFGAGSSVNNLGGTGWLDGPQGPLSVAPGTAHIVSVGNSGLRSQSILAVVSPSGLISTKGAAILNTGKVGMLGSIRVDGFESYTKAAPTGGDVFSLADKDAVGLIRWSPSQPGDAAKIDGNVGIVSTNPNAIHMGSATVTGNANDFGRNPLAPPLVDISGRIDAHSGMSTPTLNPLQTTIGAGSHYFPGDLNYDGEIVLDGANIYVSGDVNIEGSIKGRGSLLVGGETKLYGHADITPADEEGVAIYSRGSITLKGFDAENYLRSLANVAGVDGQGVAFAEHLDNLDTGLSHMYELIRDHGPSGPNPNSTLYGANNSDFDKVSNALGHTFAWSSPLPFTSDVDRTNPIARLRTLLDGQPPSEARDFLLRRLNVLSNPTADDGGLFGYGTSAAVRSAWVPDLLAGTSLNGLSDIANDGTAGGFLGGGVVLTTEQSENLENRLLGVLSQLAHGQFTRAQFQGVLYTNGYIHSTNDVNVTGAVLAIDDGSQSPGQAGSYNLEPGDILFERDASVTWIEELEFNTGNTLGTMGIRHWVKL